MDSCDKQRAPLEAILANLKKNHWFLQDFFSLSLARGFISGDYAYNINSFPKLLSLYKSTLNLSLYNLNLSNITYIDGYAASF
jgi:hypothetical protein